MNAWLYYSLSGLLIVGGALCWLSNLLSLPGNWVFLGLAALFWYFAPQEGERGLTGTTIVILLGLAVLGEVLEFAAGAVGAAKQGASRRSVWLSLIGAIAGSVAGAIVGLPIPLVGSLLAALVGGAGGAFVGAYLGEAWNRASRKQSLAVATGAFKGRLWGTAAKFAVGGVMLAVTAVDLFFV